jgi:hypothetical protein
MTKEGEGVQAGILANGKLFRLSFNGELEKNDIPTEREIIQKG